MKIGDEKGPKIMTQAATELNQLQAKSNTLKGVLTELSISFNGIVLPPKFSKGTDGNDTGRCTVLLWPKVRWFKRPYSPFQKLCFLVSLA